MKTKQDLKRSCPVCQNAASADILHTQKFVLPDNHILPREYDLVACSQCGFVYADTPADQSVYDKYYSEMSKYETPYIDADTTLFAHRAEWISGFLRDADASIVDVGCGNGQLFLELRKLGFSELTALDPSQECIDAIRRKGLGGLAGSIFEVSTVVQFDAVILSGVLEHICDVPVAMEKIVSLTRPGGLVFVFVPDAARYRDYDAIPYDYFNIEHLNHFDETSLISLGLAHGFRTVGLLKTTIALAQSRQPVIYCAYAKTGGGRIKWQEYSKECVLQYLARTEGNRGAMDVIDGLIKSNEEIIVWGAGNYTSRLLATSNLDKCNIAMFVDNDPHKHGTCLGGKTVSAPDAIVKLKKASTILVCAAVFHDEILRQIRQMGIENKVTVLR